MASNEVVFIGAMKRVTFDNEGAGQIVFMFSAKDALKAAQIAHMHDLSLEITVKVSEDDSK